MPLRNPHIGEVELADSGIRIIFTARAWIAIEQRLGKSMLQILQDAASNMFGMNEMLVLMEEGADAYSVRHKQRNHVVRDELLALLDEHGLDLMEDLAKAIAGSPALGSRDETQESADPLG